MSQWCILHQGGWGRACLMKCLFFWVIRNMNVVSEDEIKEALFGMGDNKASGVDGFNAYFFKNT